RIHRQHRDAMALAPDLRDEGLHQRRLAGARGSRHADGEGMPGVREDLVHDRGELGGALLHEGDQPGDRRTVTSECTLDERHRSFLPQGDPDLGVQPTATTRRTSGTSSRMMRSTPARRVTGDMGQPSQAPKSRIVTTPSAIPTSSMSPPSSRTAGRIFSRARRTSSSTMPYPNSPGRVPNRSAFVDEGGGDLPGDANELVGSL